jgi:hypothetical protein
MALANDVKRACRRLATHGWRQLFTLHGLDITADDLAGELGRPLAIRRDVPGFEDFALEGRRGIEPGRPARSLLYHAFASPAVVTAGAGRVLTAFPTAAEIATVENYVFARRGVSLADLRREAGGARLAVAVFACEYRLAADTAHGKHADLTLSRTGVTRVGTKPARYLPDQRGFSPFGRADRDIPVLPARYAAYIAVRRRGDGRRFGPLGAVPGDGEREFWVPVHKLFPGRECLSGLDLEVALAAHHVNEKLRRAWTTLFPNRRRGRGAPALDQPPFTFSKRIAELSRDRTLGPGWLVPLPHALCEVARYRGEVLTYPVPEHGDTLSSSVRIPDEGNARHAPEYVHARHLANGKSLNDSRHPDDDGRLHDVDWRVEKGGYAARHYVDFTGDGWIEATCAALERVVGKSVPAYSLVAPPDFFPDVSQRRLLDWTRKLPEPFRTTVWRVDPETLADSRLPANLSLRDAKDRRVFATGDDTVSAIVSLPLDGNEAERPTPRVVSRRHPYLPDTAAGVFAPGWDVSFDQTRGVDHLAGYGLGSPFPEDVKLCAALSTFWPAVAPDTARAFPPKTLGRDWPTVCPLTDDELGASGQAWDGVAGPRFAVANGRRVVDYPNFPYVDYVENARAGRFSLAATGRVDQEEYQRRVLFMARLYAAVGVTATTWAEAQRQKAEWGILSFRVVPPEDEDRKRAERARGVDLGNHVRYFEMFRPGARPPSPDHRRVFVEIQQHVTAYVGLDTILLRRDDGGWDIHH